MVNNFGCEIVNCSNSSGGYLIGGRGIDFIYKVLNFLFVENILTTVMVGFILYGIVYLTIKEINKKW